MEHIDRLELLYQLNRYQQLLDETQRQLASDHTDVAAALYHLLALYSQQAFDEADQAAQRLQSQCHSHSFFWLIKTQIALRLNRLTQAEQCAQRALSLAYHDADNHDNLAQVMLHQQQISKAQFHLLEALSLDPWHREARLHLAQLYGSLCLRPDLAKTLLREHLQHQPQDAFALELLAQYSASPWQKQRLLQQILRFDPLNRDVAKQLNQQVRRQIQAGLAYAVLALLGIMTHLWPNLASEDLLGGIRVGLLLASFALTVWVFSWDEKLPALGLMLLMLTQVFPPQEWDLITFLISGGIAAVLTLNAYWLSRLLAWLQHKLSAHSPSQCWQVCRASWKVWKAKGWRGLTNTKETPDE